MSDFPKTTVEQTVEIESLVSEALETLDQIRYSLKTLEDRLKAVAPEPRTRAPGPVQSRRKISSSDGGPASPTRSWSSSAIVSCQRALTSCAAM
jgi:hypothetical protein